MVIGKVDRDDRVLPSSAEEYVDARFESGW